MPYCTRTATEFEEWEHPYGPYSLAVRCPFCPDELLNIETLDPWDETGFDLLTNDRHDSPKGGA